MRNLLSRFKLFLLIIATPLLVSLKGNDAYEEIKEKSGLIVEAPHLKAQERKKLRLSNGLEVLLISDPNTEESGAALAVEAGSFQDPTHYPGMAHFCEHMLFLGTKKYPTEDGYQKYIQENGGTLNAYTASDMTVYMFSVKNEAFDGALDRFSHFFIDPIFSQNSVDRELNAVDQEHSKNIENDMWRNYMIIKETSNPNHPFHLFSTGDKSTLGGIPRSALIEWYSTHYSADKMHLAVVSKLPMKELTQEVVSHFGDVPVRKKSAPTPLPENVFTKEQEGHMIYIQPVSKVNELNLIWELPQEFATNNGRQMANLIAHVISTETSHSVSRLLKKKHLISEDISADTSFPIGKDRIAFSISATLTKQGVEEVDTVINDIFQAINLIKEQGVPSYIYDEQVKMKKIAYAYRDRKKVFIETESLASSMPLESLDTFPRKSLLPEKYDSQLIEEIARSLTAQKCLFIVTADPKITGAKLDHKEKWMGANYSVKPISHSLLNSWSLVKASRDIALPGKNRYIPDSVKPIEETVSKSDENTIPEKLINTPVGTIYYAKDTQFLQPKTAFAIAINTPAIDGSAKNDLLSTLYCRAHDFLFAENLMNAGAAGIQSSMSTSLGKLEFYFQGYDDSLESFILDASKALVEQKLSKEAFETLKEQIANECANVENALPLRQAFTELSTMIREKSPTVQEQLEVLKTLTHDDFVSFSRTLFKQGFIEGTVYGSMSPEDVKKLWKKIDETFELAPYPKEQRTKEKVLEIPAACGPYYTSKTTEMQGNSTVLYFEIGSYDFKKRALLQVLSSAIGTEFYDTLRTKQQTGYIVLSADLVTEKQMGLYFAVQSNKYEPDELRVRYDLFLEQFLIQINDNFSEEQFKTIRDSAIDEVSNLRRGTNMREKVMLLNTCAFEWNGNFHLVNQRVKALEAITYDDCIAFAKEMFSRANRKRISIQVKGKLTDENDFEYSHVTPSEIKKSGKYREAM